MTVDITKDVGDAAPKMLARWAIGVTGLLLTVAGTIAVFVKDTNVAGVPLLIIAGAGFLYVALTGQRLIQVNKDGVTFARLKDYERTLDQVSKDPDIPVETKERIVDAAEANGINLWPRISGHELEERVQDLLLSVGAQHAFDVQRAHRPNDRGWDLLLTNTSGRRLAVEVKNRMRTRGFLDTVHRLRQLEIPERLLVIEGGVPEELAAPFERDNLWILGLDEDLRDRTIALLRQINFIAN